MTNGDGECCTSAPTPARDNPPGRSELRYRVGTHSSFLASMLGQLSKQGVPPNDTSGRAARPLAELSTRSTDDSTIALLDAWAAALDVLTFYDERYVQEGFLPTATLRESVFALAKSIGYAPSPGVAASTSLAFTIDDSTGGPESVTIPSGSAALSIPTAAPSLDRPAITLRPQAFETVETIEARPDWNVLRPTSTLPVDVQRGMRVLYFDGVATRLSTGDRLLVTGKQRADTTGAALSERWDLRAVESVELDMLNLRTKVTLDRGLGDAKTAPANEAVKVFVFRDRGSLFGFDAPDFRAMSDSIKAAYGGQISTNPAKFRTRWPGFLLSEDETTGTYLAKKRGVIDLDREYGKLVQGGWVCLEGRTDVEAYRIEQLSPSSRTDFTLTAKCTRLFLDGYENLTRFQRRSTVVHLQSERLSLTGPPDMSDVFGQEVRISGVPSEMSPGRSLIARGSDAVTGEPRVERVTLRTFTPDGTDATRLRFEAPLLYRYRREGFELLGNVAAATHGTSVAEAIGSGDASAYNQRFPLLQPPLTFVAAATDSGRASTLELTIDGVRWTQVDALLDAGPSDRAYQLDIDADGKAQVILGDGEHGALPPSGLENVKAKYRKGIGLDGEVAAGTIGLMTSGPPGVRSVTNPVPATGAEDPESIEGARRNAPLTVLTLGRLVSISDYEDFARAFAGIGKAHSAELWTGKRSVVHLTVGSASGTTLDETGDTVRLLRSILTSNADPSQVPLVSTFELVTFAVHLRVIPDPAYDKDALGAAIRAALLAAFAYEQRQFAQPVAASEVVAVVQAVPGVVALDLDALHRVGEPESFQAVLVARPAGWSGYGVTRAELLLASETHLTVDWIQT